MIKNKKKFSSFNDESNAVIVLKFKLVSEKNVN